MAIYSKLQPMKTVLEQMRAPAFYLDEVRRFIYQKGRADFRQMTGLPQNLRQALCDHIGPILSLKNIGEATSKQAQKILFATRDGQRLETVRMLFQIKNGGHESLCLSSQSGCALGCKFCATGAMGFKKNLTAEEISDQVLYFKTRQLKIKSIAFMGMGEPLANIDNVFGALKVITDPDYLGFSPRRISLSTVGIVPGIKRLTKEWPQVNLAFSLHSPFPAQRVALMPITKVYPIDKVMPALDDHIRKTNKRVFLAYVLLAGVNDSSVHAQALVKLVQGRGNYAYLYHVNLIRFNPGASLIKFAKPARDKIGAFRQVLRLNNISHTLRQSFGVSIAAACGQLAGKQED